MPQRAPMMSFSRYIIRRLLMIVFDIFARAEAYMNYTMPPLHTPRAAGQFSSRRERWGVIECRHCITFFDDYRVYFVIFMTMTLHWYDDRDVIAADISPLLLSFRYGFSSHMSLLLAASYEMPSVSFFTYIIDDFIFAMKRLLFSLRVTSPSYYTLSRYLLPLLSPAFRDATLPLAARAEIRRDARFSLFITLSSLLFIFRHFRRLIFQAAAVVITLSFTIDYAADIIISPLYASHGHHW